MTRFLSIAVLGLATAGAFLWTPSTSNAQPVGVGVQVGGLGFGYNSGYPYAGYPYAGYPVPAAVPFNPVMPGYAPSGTVIVPTSGYYPYGNYYRYGSYRPNYGHYNHRHH